MTTSVNRPPLEGLSCVNADCDQYGQSGQAPLIVRKSYGKDQIRYLRCRCCGAEFSERKLTGLWNCKIPEERAIRVGQPLAEGTSLKGTARLTTPHLDTVRRWAVKFGHHADRFHDQQAQDLEISTLEMDERHGYAETKAQPQWDAVSIDPSSKFLVQVEVGPRDATLIERLLRGRAQRLKDPQDLVLMTDGEASYRTLLPELFGVPYSPPVKVQPVGSPRPRIGFPARWPMCKS